MVTMDMKVEWRSAITIFGVLCVRTFLVEQTVQWSAGNWDWAMQVCVISTSNNTDIKTLILYML